MSQHAGLHKVYSTSSYVISNMKCNIGWSCEPHWRWS